MKEVCMSIMVLSLAVQGFSSESLDDFTDYLNYLEEFQKERFAHLREEYKDVVKLKAYFEKGLLVSPVSDKEMLTFKRKFGVSDETMLTALMGIIRETAAKTEWEWRKSYEDSYDINGRLLKAIRWLGVCADTETKTFLMGIVTDNAKDYDFRRNAIGAYLRRADAQETRNAITRFFTDDMREVGKNGFSVSHCVYGCALQTYDETENNAEKREAVVASLSIALVKEENQKVFVEVDKVLAERSKAYAESPQRKAALQRFNIPAEKEEQ